MTVLVIYAGTTQGAVTIQTDMSNPQQTTAMAGYATYSDDMNGMTVTVNGSDSGTWGYLGSHHGTTYYGAQGNGWYLYESGDTFTSNWNFYTNQAVSSLLIDAGTGNTMFDIIHDEEYTSGSSIGREFELTSSYSGDIAVTYSAPVSLTGDAFQGDLYRTMLIEFANPFTGSLTFRADTDNAAFAGDIEPTPVPAPGALILTGLGTSLAGYIRRRKLA